MFSLNDVCECLAFNPVTGINFIKYVRDINSYVALNVNFWVLKGQDH